jgi:hypothetical protein
MHGGHGKVGEIDGEIRGLLVPRQTGSGVGEPCVAPPIDGVAAKLETTAVQGYGSSLLGALFKRFGWLAEGPVDRAASNDP